MNPGMSKNIKNEKDISLYAGYFQSDGTLKDTILRRQADFENYKKRHHKIQKEQKKLAVKDLALDIIHINDDLLRAIEASSNIQADQSFEDAHKSFVDGVSMISNRIEEALKKYDVVEIDALNKEFDPNYFEAVEIEMAENVVKDTVTKVYQKGFRIDDIVVRSSKVKVSKPIREEAKTDEETASDDSDISDSKRTDDDRTNVT